MLLGEDEWQCPRMSALQMTMRIASSNASYPAGIISALRNDNPPVARGTVPIDAFQLEKW
jgi:hypothetical protein